MNYFEHHIGDYAAATAHLSLLEDAVYSRLLRRYYLQEEPLPAEVRLVARLVGARAAEEVEAVQVVLEEFFTLQEDGWHNKRADEEIARYQAKVDAARENGKRGGRPPKNPEVSAEKAKETQPFSPGSISETQLKAHQTPVTKQKSKSKSAVRLTAHACLLIGGHLPMTSPLLSASAPMWTGGLRQRSSGITGMASLARRAANRIGLAHGVTGSGALTPNARPRAQDRSSNIHSVRQRKH